MKVWPQLLLTLCCLMIWPSSVFSFDEEAKDRNSSASKRVSLSLDPDNSNSHILHQAVSLPSSSDSKQEVFNILPPEICGYIGQFIPGDELQNYLLTSRRIYTTCIKDISLTAGPHPDQLFSIINANGFRGLRNLTLIWKLSDPKKVVFLHTIQQISSMFSDHDYTYEYEEARPVTELEYRVKMRGFIIDAKCKFLLYHLGAADIKKTLTDFKQSKLRQYFDWPEGIENYPYAFRWTRMQVTLCHPNAFKHLYPEVGENISFIQQQEQKEALKYKTSFVPFLHLMRLFKTPMEKTDIFPNI